MNTLVIAVVTGKGGKYFELEADAFARYWRDNGDNVHVCKLHKDRPSRLANLVKYEIANCPHEQTDRVAFFCHGTPKWLMCGYNVWNVRGLVSALAAKCVSQLDVALYACSTGRPFWTWPWHLTEAKWMVGEIPGKAGFAARLTEALANRGMQARVFAHGTRGKACMNPYCYRFTVGAGGAVIYRKPMVKRFSAEWKQWKKRLQTWYRFVVPFV